VAAPTAAELQRRRGSQRHRTQDVIPLHVYLRSCASYDRCVLRYRRSGEVIEPHLSKNKGCSKAALERLKIPRVYPSQTKTFVRQIATNRQTQCIVAHFPEEKFAAPQLIETSVVPGCRLLEVLQPTTRRNDR
jgi:hypothetical protein